MKSFLTLSAFCLALAAPAFAANEPAQSSATLTTSPKIPTLNVDFPGGTLNDLLLMLRSSHEAISFNVIASDPADLQTPVPPFALRNANAGSIYRILRTFLELRQLRLEMVDGTDTGVTALIVPFPKSIPLEPAQSSELISFQLEPYLGRYAVDDIVSAVRTAWELDPAHPHDALRLKFHPGTKILLVAGPREVINTAREVIVNLQRDPDPAPASKSSPAAPPKS